ncbi:BrnT family toxin [bacterium]|nr:BrnT family toxin [bacterium]MCI0611644.1 BrnT family toxin [bacterium]
MKVFDWDKKKNEKLVQERGISFETIVLQIEAGNVIAIVRGEGKFRHQKQYIVEFNNYVYIVPFVEGPEVIFLKTIIPSRKLTKRLLLGGD